MQLTMQQAQEIDRTVVQSANDIIQDKRTNYSGTVDPYRNFRIAGMLAGIEPWQVALSRMGDKLSRIRSMCEAGMTQANWDDLMSNDFPDAVNYARIIAGLAKELVLSDQN